jgi:hypothetical protein
MAGTSLDKPGHDVEIVSIMAKAGITWAGLAPDRTSFDAHAFSAFASEPIVEADIAAASPAQFLQAFRRPTSQKQSRSATTKKSDVTLH